MNVELFSVFDQAAKKFMDPFCAPTIEFAIRGFRQACTQKDHQFQMYPEDYVLFQVGTFNATDGTMDGMIPTKIAMAISFVHGAQIELEEQITLEEGA